MQRGSLQSPTLAYETRGELSATADNAVLIFTGLSPSAHAASNTADPSAGWWEDMVGPGKPIDINRYFVICVNSLGSCFGSTGPASLNPDTNELYRMTFRILCVEDIANAASHVLDAVGVKTLHTVVGSSMGGMTALAFALMFPDRTRRLVSISSAARSLPFPIALRSLQREIIRKDPDWQNGQYELSSNGPLAACDLRVNLA